MFTGDFTPVQLSKYVVPHYDPDYIKKLEATLNKASAYLDKANALSWWNAWLQHAQEMTTPSEPQELEGKFWLTSVPGLPCSLCHVYMYVFRFTQISPNDVFSILVCQNRERP